MTPDTTIEVQSLLDAGAHIGYTRARRHPTAKPFIFGTKEKTDIFDVENTKKAIEAASEYIASLAQAGKQVLFVSGKNESLEILRETAESLNMPFVAGRWIGGTLTNFKNIRKRVDLLERLTGERERGELIKYTKRERLMIDRDIERLNTRFGGLLNMHDLPAALFVIDSRHERIAVEEANQMNIPVIALASSDCDFSRIKYPIPANDTSIRSVRLVCDAVAAAYTQGKGRGGVAQGKASVR